MPPIIICVRDRSREFAMKPGSAVEFTYEAEAEFEGERFHFKDKLWVNFNEGRFLFSWRPDEGKWQKCSIAGNINEGKKIEVFPCDKDTFMCSIDLYNVSPLKSTKSGDCIWKRGVMMFRGPQGHLYDEQMTFLALLYYQDCQGVYQANGATSRRCIRISQKVKTVLTPLIQEAERHPFVCAFLWAAYCADRSKGFERKLKLLADKGIVLRADNGERVDSVAELEREGLP